MFSGFSTKLTISPLDPPVVFHLADSGQVFVSNLRKEFNARASKGFIDPMVVVHFIMAVDKQIKKKKKEKTKKKYEKDKMLIAFSMTSMSFWQLREAFLRYFGSWILLDDEKEISSAPVPLAADGALPPIPPPVSARVVVLQPRERPVEMTVILSGVTLYRDVLYSIFVHLDARTILVSCSRVCKLFNLLSKEDNLWARFNSKNGFNQIRDVGFSYSFSGIECRRYKANWKGFLKQKDLTCLACKIVFPSGFRVWKESSGKVLKLFWRSSWFFVCENCTTSLKCARCLVPLPIDDRYLLDNCSERFYDHSPFRPKCKQCSQ